MNPAEKPLPLAAWPWIISREKLKGAVMNENARWAKLPEQLNALHEVIRPVEFYHIVSNKKLPFYDDFGKEKLDIFRCLEGKRLYCCAIILCYACTFTNYESILIKEESLFIKKTRDFLSADDPDLKDFFQTEYTFDDMKKDMFAVFAWALCTYIKIAEIKKIKSIFSPTMLTIEPKLSQESERAAITPLSENPLLSERIVELEGQLAEARQENEALRAEMVELKGKESVDARRRSSYLAVIAGAICTDETTGPLWDSKRTGIIKRNLEGLGLHRKHDTIKSVLTEAAEFAEKMKGKESQ